jgi:hypothetical protein
MAYPLDPNDPKTRATAADLVEAIFCDSVETGTIQIGDRTPQEILDEFRVYIGEFKLDIHDMNERGEDSIHAILDHRSTLLGYANREASDGRSDVAVVFYALWIEHTVNGCLIRGLERKGYGPEVINPLIRELSLRTKITALWSVAGFPPLTDENVRTIDQVAQFRNSFVHYKYPGYAESMHESMNEQLRRATERAQNLISAFDAAMNTLFWNGREEEIISAFREEYR